MFWVWVIVLGNIFLDVTPTTNYHVCYDFVGPRSVNQPLKFSSVIARVEGTIFETTNPQLVDTELSECKHVS